MCRLRWVVEGLNRGTDGRLVGRRSGRHGESWARGKFWVVLDIEGRNGSRIQVEDVAVVKEEKEWRVELAFLVFHARPDSDLPKMNITCSVVAFDDGTRGRVESRCLSLAIARPYVESASSVLTQVCLANCTDLSRVCKHL